jgi:hypothetical protein
MAASSIGVLFTYTTVVASVRIDTDVCGESLEASRAANLEISNVHAT